MAVCVAGVGAPQLHALLFGADGVAGGHVDDAAGDQLAGIPVDGIGVFAGSGGVCEPDSAVCAGSVCRGMGGPVGPSPSAGGDAGAFNGAIAAAGAAGADASHYGPGHCMALVISRAD